jgi:hypothetical protein
MNASMAEAYVKKLATTVGAGGPAWARAASLLDGFLRHDLREGRRTSNPACSSEQVVPKLLQLPLQYKSVVG